ncbi:MAG: hypothetical protein K2O45_06950, partial [Oscillospiraceae bacterium]|nr:hypothetical protein [Oscillospiraceae bacterium]
MKKWKNLGRRGLSLLVCLMMCLSMLPGVAYAGEAELDEHIHEDEYVDDFGIALLADGVDTSHHTHDGKCYLCYTSGEHENKERVWLWFIPLPKDWIARCSCCGMYWIKGTGWTDDPKAYCDMFGHTFGEAVSNNDATCLNDGTKTKTCGLCEHQETETDRGSKKPHSYTAAWMPTTNGHERYCDYGCGTKDPASGSHQPTPFGETVEATCVTPGQTAGSKCSVCDYVIVEALKGSFDRNNHKHTENKVEVPATCTAPGTEAGVWCNDCSSWVSGGDEIDALDHDFIGAAWQKDDTEHWHVCTREGCDAPDTKTPHSYTDYTWNKDAKEWTGTCVCGKTDVKAELPENADHTCVPGDTWVPGETQHWHTCIGCGEVVESSMADHSYTGYTWNEDAKEWTGTCVCGKTDVKAELPENAD